MAERPPRGASLLRSLFTRIFRLRVRLRAIRALPYQPLCKFSAAVKVKHPVERGFITSELILDILVLQVTAMLLLLRVYTADMCRGS